MWALRILNGPQAGHIYVLKQGRNRIGRADNCDLKLSSPGISKEHLEIQVAGKTVVIKDLNSSNGTFLNGVRVEGAAVKMGDKISLHQVLFDIVPAPTQMMVVQPQQHHYPSQTQTAATQGYHQPASEQAAAPAPAPSFGQTLHQLQMNFEHYINEVALPGIYRLVEVFQFRSVMFGFAVFFIFMVTLLSLFPMNQITSESIRTESRRRAQTVARALANSNERAIRSGEMSSYSADLVLRDEGISHVYILSKDGTIIAPPEMVGLTAKNIAGFVTKIKGQTREMSDEVGDGQIAASCPILVFDPELQQNVAKAHAVVVYDTGSMKFDDGRALGLFVQMLAIALALGALVFFMMYKLVEYPFKRLNQEIDTAMREGRDHAHLDIKFPILQQLLVSLNSLIARSHQSQGGSASMSASTRDEEWSNMLQLFGFPGMVLSKDLQILSVNNAFQILTGIQMHLVQGQSLAYITDAALRENIRSLTTQATANTQSLHVDNIDISGHNFLVRCQAITVAGEARYFLIGISPKEEMAEGGAA